MTHALAILAGLLDQPEPFACCNVKVVMSAVTVTRSSRVTSRSNPGSICIELAASQDWHALSDLERASFPGDRISPRSWRSFLTSQSAIVTVARSVDAGSGLSTIVGAAVLLQRARTSVARLYSIAIARSARGRGVSAALLEDATQRMRDAGAAVLRLETRLDNVAAQHLFAKCGFVQRGRRASYYEDGEDALLYQKSLWNLRAAERDAALSAPCYGQTLEFRCGPCALLMAMITPVAGDPDMTITVDGFHRITRYGRRRQTAAVVISKEY